MPELICRGCDQPHPKRILSLGDIPLVNAFLDADEVAGERCPPLNLARCSRCSLVQLEELVPPQELFCHYLHLSAASAPNREHLKVVVDMLAQRGFIGKDTRLMEIGCNDGTLLGFAKDKVQAVLGVDPAKNLAALNNERGIETIADFFSTRLANEIVNSHGQQDAIVALNVVAHTPSFVDLLQGVEQTLCATGVFMMEAAYVVETILQGQFDTIYHEHVYCFSLHSLMAAMKRANLEIFDVEKIPTQGGSLRVFAHKASDTSHAVSDRVGNLLEHEKNLGLGNDATYDVVDHEVQEFRRRLRALIDERKRKDGRLIGLGAPARGIVILNYCQIGKDDLEFIVDDTPLKQGKLAPGMHVPIKSMDAVVNMENKSFLLLAWNYREHMLERLAKTCRNATVIVPFPKLEIIEIAGS
jgi:hypothetical protein